MVIKKIHVNEFGKLKDREFSLGEGLNVIRGDNESGKSTLMSFIRFVFYGLPQARGTDNLTERERSLSWDGGIASGYIEISAGGEDFRVERSVSYTSAERKSIISLKTGAPVFAGADAGDIFFGVPGDVYDSVCASKQLGVGELDGRAVGGAIQNMLLTGDESVDTDGAMKKLDKARRELSALRGGGGRVNELKRAKETLEGKLLAARENTDTILSLQNTVEKYRALSLETRRLRDSAEDACHAAESVDILKKFGILHEKQEKIGILEAGLSGMTKKYGQDGKLPDGSYTSYLDALYRKKTGSDVELSEAKARFSEAKAAPGGDPVLAERHARIIKAGGTETVTEACAAMMKKARSIMTLGIVFAAAGALLLAGGLLWTFVFTAPGAKLPPAAAVLMTAGLCLAAAGIALIPAAVKKEKKVSGYLGEFGIGIAPRSDLRAGIEASADKFAEAAALNEVRLKRIAEAEASLKEKTDENAAVISECEKALKLFPAISDEAEDGSDEAERLTGKRTAAEKIIADYEALSNRLELLKADESELLLATDGYDEAVLRSHLLPEAERRLEEIGAPKLSQDRDALVKKLDAVNQKLADSEKNLAVLTHTTENPIRLSAELESVGAELESAENRLEAIVLAQEMIKEAGISLKANVTPRLRARAGELLTKITDGRYTEIGIDDDFNVLISTGSGTRPVSLLSGGTKDAAWFALRISLLEMIFRDSVPPLLLDETAAQLDDERTNQFMAMLTDVAAEGIQILHFTCHRREELLLSKSGAQFSLTVL